MSDYYLALDTGTTMNPRHPEGADFYAPEQVIYVLGMGDLGDSRVAYTSYGRVYGPNGRDMLTFGDTILVKDNDTDDKEWVTAVVGIVCNGVAIGRVADRDMPHWVCK